MKHVGLLLFVPVQYHRVPHIHIIPFGSMIKYVRSPVPVQRLASL
jgi:hypothetical protein